MEIINNSNIDFSSKEAYRNSFFNYFGNSNNNKDIYKSIKDCRNRGKGINCNSKYKQKLNGEIIITTHSNTCLNQMNREYNAITSNDDYINDVKTFLRKSDDFLKPIQVNSFLNDFVKNKRRNVILCTNENIIISSTFQNNLDIENNSKSNSNINSNFVSNICKIESEINNNLLLIKEEFEECQTCNDKSSKENDPFEEFKNNLILRDDVTKITYNNKRKNNDTTYKIQLDYDKLSTIKNFNDFKNYLYEYTKKKL